MINTAKTQKELANILHQHANVVEYSEDKIELMHILSTKNEELYSSPFIKIFDELLDSLIILSCCQTINESREESNLFFCLKQATIWLKYCARTIDNAT